MNINLHKDYEVLMPTDEQMPIIKSRIFKQIRLEIDKMVPTPVGHVIGGDGNSGELCIDVDEKIWVVYYCERGIRYNCAFFPGSINAANYFLAELIRGNPKSAKIQPFLIHEAN